MYIFLFDFERELERERTAAGKGKGNEDLDCSFHLITHHLNIQLSSHPICLLRRHYQQNGKTGIEFCRMRRIFSHAQNKMSANKKKTTEQHHVKCV